MSYHVSHCDRRPATVQPPAAATVHQILSRCYRLILIDTDNDESAPHWLGMLDHVDLLVVSTTNRDTHAETGWLMLEESIFEMRRCPS